MGSNVRVLPPDAFILNCKILVNDLSQVRQIVNRMWASSRNDTDQMMLEYMEEHLVEMLDDLRATLDYDAGGP